MRFLVVVAVAIFGPVSWAVGQSSSLYRAHETRQAEAVAAATQPAANGSVRVNAGAVGSTSPNQNIGLARHSLTAISLPEPTVVKINDLIGIVIRHRFRSQTESRVKLESEWDVLSKLDAWFRLHDKKWNQQDLQRGTPEVQFRNTNDMENKGRSNRQDVLETRVMGKVIDVKPNGNLILAARYSIGNGEDLQQITVTGEVATRDIGPDRTITSDKVFDLRVSPENTGSVGDNAKRGWFKTLLDKMKAF